MHDFSATDLDILDSSKNGFSETEANGSLITANKDNIPEPENGDSSIRRVLGTYEIGQKLRQLRLRKKNALVDLAKHTGHSASKLSQLENGKLIPTLPTLARIAMVFDVGLEHFFIDKRMRRTFAIVRRDERMRFPDRTDSPVPGYFFEVLAFGAGEKSLAAYLAEFISNPEVAPREHVHAGSEFIHVIAGTLVINYQAEEHILQEGDSVYFDGAEPHSYSGRSDTPTRAIIITTPPRL